MLHYNTVLPTLVEVLRLLMPLDELRAFRLVGGTSLALQLGHRISDDIDLFTDRSFDVAQLAVTLRQVLPGMEISIQTRNGLQLVWNGCKADIYNWAVPFADDFIEIDGIRLASLKDIAAFKLDAITTRQTEKDYYDLYFLLLQFSLSELLAHRRRIFGQASDRTALNALSLEYTLKAREGEPARLLKPLPFSAVQEALVQCANEYVEGLKRTKEAEAFNKTEQLRLLL